MMIFYTTFHLSDGIYERGLEYLKKTYIPAATQSGVLCSPRMLRVINEVEDATGTSVSVQFSVADRETLEKWIKKEGVKLQREMFETFKDEMLGFSTLLEEIDLE